MGPFGPRRQWLSITPEPERELPWALATLRAGGAPTPALVEAEQARAERLVTRARRRAWSAYLEEAGRLAEAAGDANGSVGAARELVQDVLRNHNGLLLGIERRPRLRRRR